VRKRREEKSVLETCVVRRAELTQHGGCSVVLGAGGAHGETGDVVEMSPSCRRLVVEVMAAT
jgi:hypothetical protein